MDVLGAFVRVQAGRYLAGFALVRDTTLLDTWSLAAPADLDEGGQLGELQAWVADRIQHHPVDAVSIKGTEAGSGKAVRVAQHGEGAILAAAGRANKPTKVWTGQGYRAAVGATNNPGVLKRAEADLSGAWPSTSEAQQAAAAALALIRRPA